jgi:hypothetical protein
MSGAPRRCGVSNGLLFTAAQGRWPYDMVGEVVGEVVGVPESGTPA